MIFGHLKKLLALDDAAERVALAFAVGVALAFSPLLGLHTILGLAIAFAFRLNRAAVLLGVFVNNPWTIVPIYTAGAYLGWCIIGFPPSLALPDFRWTYFWNSRFWIDLFRPGSVLRAVVLGSAILSIIAGFASYPLALWVIRRGRAYRGRLRHVIL